MASTSIKRHLKNSLTERSTSLGTFLLQKEIISADQLQVALVEAQKTKKPFETVLVTLGFLTEQKVSDYLSETSGIPQINLYQTVLESACFSLIPKEMALKYRSVAVCVQKDSLHLAMADPTDILTLDALRYILPKHLEIKPFIATESSIKEAIQRLYEPFLSAYDILHTSNTESREGSETPAVQLLDSFILEAVQKGASDIHFEPEPSFVRIRYRIDGLLRQKITFHGDLWPSLAVRIKILSSMNIAETRAPQDGRFSRQVEGREVDFRVSSHPTVHGENIVIRILDKTHSLKPLDTLGFPLKIVTHIKKCLQKPEGLVIMTGPTGSGKTTTLYSLLNHISSPEVNIMTLEQPIEYELPLIRQTEIREDSGLSFAEGVRSILRQDPDIIFIGEIRDKETAQMALQAAMTGHQVYTTLHTNTALGALQRLEDLGIPLTLLGGNLICLLSQRLVRKLCAHCKTLHQDKGRVPSFEAIGCSHCEGSGYKGRLPLVELIECSETFNRLIRQKAPLKNLTEEARKTGFLSLEEAAHEMILRGDTSLEEILKVITLEKLS